LNDRIYDIAIIGGGVNGCGIARDAAGRGLSVYLAEKDDLAFGTSSASTKLIHGGLRYLEHYEFGLVRESLSEREVLWAMAPHIIHPLRFVLPYSKGLRPAWLIRLGLFLYDHLGGRKRLPGCRSLDLKEDPAGRPLRDGFSKAFEYSDCWVDDARLVVLNARDAADKGATIATRTEVTAAKRQEGLWQVDTVDKATGQRETIRARALVNATGPWIGSVVTERIGASSRGRIRLVKGSHIVVPRMFDHERAYIFQNSDKRIVFAIPYQGQFTLIGTTDVDFTDRPEDAHADASEIDYLCRTVGEYFSVPLSPDQIVWSYSGIRPLYDDGASEAQKATRDYVLELDGGDTTPPVVNVFGGKITTYRLLAENVLRKLNPFLPAMGEPWTKGASLPGGAIALDGKPALLAEMLKAFPGIDAKLLARLVDTYGTQTPQILGDAKSEADLGRDFGAGLHQRELEHLVANEWARNAEDVLWRRTKLGLNMSNQQVTELSAWLEAFTAVN